MLKNGGYIQMLVKFWRADEAGGRKIKFWASFIYSVWDKKESSQQWEESVNVSVCK
jgi:hypothetical protein